MEFLIVVGPFVKQLVDDDIRHAHSSIALRSLPSVSAATTDAFRNIRKGGSVTATRSEMAGELARGSFNVT